MFRATNVERTSMSRVLTCLLALVCGLGVLQNAAAQSSNGQITGLVTDSTGAAVEGATVVATNTATGVEYTTRSNGSGVYVLPQLVPGPYKVSLSHQGFATVERPDVAVRTGDRLSLDFSLKPATTKEVVTVTESLPLLQADQSSESTVLDNKMITELPQLNRNSLDLTGVTPQVQGKGPLSDNIASLGNATYLIANNGNSYAVSGGQVNGTNISVDGNQIQDSEFNAVNRAIPTPDSIGEFRVESGVLTADHGRYSGGVITMNTKSGTNELHGRLFEYFRNQIFNSNGWQNNDIGATRQAFHQNNYGLSLGGPLTIPHVYNGANRTFFYFGWEGERYNTGAPVLTTVPTALQQQGDFSQTIIDYNVDQTTGVKTPYYAAIFDPFHLDSNGNRMQYGSVPGAPVGFNGFSGSKICSQADLTGGTCPAASQGLSLQSTLFAHYMALYPQPNHVANGNDGYSNNRLDNIAITRPTDRFFVRLDENLSNSQRFNLSVSRTHMTNNIPAPWLHAARSYTYDHDVTGSLQYNWVINPTSILDVHLGFGVAKLYDDGVSGDGSAPDPSIDTTTWGFDPLIISNPSRTTSQIAPVLNIGGVGATGSPAFANVGGSQFDTFINQTTNGTVAFTKVFGRHTVKVGYEQYFYRFSEIGGDHTGVAWINNGGGSVQNWQNSGDATTGFPLAELMMGSSHVFQWGNWQITPYGFNEAMYGMDDWKVNQKLTVQIGLRWDHDGGRSPRDFGESTPLTYLINARNVLNPIPSWNWGQVTSTAGLSGLSSLPQPGWLTQGTTGQVVLLDTPPYPQKKLYTTDMTNFQPRLGMAYAFNDKTVVHASAGIVDQGMGGLSTDWFSFYYNTVTMNQISSLDGQHWVSELGPDHGLGTFPTQPSGSNLGYYPRITTNAQYSNITFGQAANPTQGGAATLNHFQSPTDYIWDVSVQRQVGRSWTATADYTGIRGIHLLMPLWGWSLNNIPLQYYQLGTAYEQQNPGSNVFSVQVPNPFYGLSQTFSSEPTLPLGQMLGLSPQYANTTPGQATWGRSFSNFLNLQIQSRGYHGLTLLASYNIRKTLTNSWGKDIQHGGPAGSGYLQNPHNLMEAYGVAGYEMPQTLLLNYSYELPFGHGRQFMSHGEGIGYKILDEAIGGWNVAGVSTWDPKGTPLLVPQFQSLGQAPYDGLTAPGAAIRWSLAPGVTVKKSSNYSSALVDPNSGSFFNGSPTKLLNPGAFVKTADFTLANSPFIFPNVRNPGAFFTDATLLKKFPIAKEGATYFELRLEAQNIFNHANFNNIDNNPNSPTFGGVLGKQQYPRIMQVGARLFF
ncbi:MAG TPA: carboxypeptidase-like regulatory domain-containing protein [Candidatus Sulfotelmatobacter sp.]|nr:carboxypeptidase-like regulatory domain-containing protein [Candidatus Sulfotelmatobacter sp.]